MRSGSSLRSSRGDAFLAIKAVSGDLRTPDQLLATVGIHSLSIRVSSWPAVGRGPERGHTFEGSWRVTEKSLVFARVDRVDRDAYELVNKRHTREGVVSERMSVFAGALGAVHDVKLLRSGTETGFGGEVSLYRFGSRFDPVDGRHPIAIYGFVRIRFGSHVASRQTSPIGHSMSM